MTKVTQEDLLLAFLRDGGQHGRTTTEILNAGINARFSARLQSLREKGHVIDTQRLAGGQFKYTLRAMAARPPLVAVPSVPVPDGHLFDPAPAVPCSPYDRDVA